eukprot:TRINITY_DN13915_c0_g1_i1.p1 TRINITY_DN13915_c0_g1~~TRINITY_DN13915_c0_g1_i1.p1  ORF type:complete len:333 (+),score=68.99 TRINITY_DN13915_c0_g1_i1:57-1001(+)
MPFRNDALGAVPRQSPLRTEPLRVWTMNFAAACGAADPRYWEAIGDAEGRVDGQPAVHPIFLPACTEVVAFWAGIYATGVSKKEAVKFPLVHATFDTTFSSPLKAGSTVQTAVDVVGVGQRRSGAHVMVRCSSSVGGVPVAVSHWGGLLVGMKDGPADSYPAQLQAAPIPPRPAADATHSIAAHLPPSAAHIWDACVRDPRKPKAANSDINVHTHLGYARAGALPHRTANGLTTLAYALGPIMSRLDPEGAAAVRRISCKFSRPVYLQYDDVHLRVSAWCQREQSRAWFEVRLEDGTLVLRDGYVELFGSSARL